MSIPSLSWAYTTRPVYAGPNLRPTAHVIIDSTRVPKALVDFIEEVLYGTATLGATMPPLAQLVDIFQNAFKVQIVDNGDGTWTATGPADLVKMTSSTEFEVTTPFATMINGNTYNIRGL